MPSLAAVYGATHMLPLDPGMGAAFNDDLARPRLQHPGIGNLRVELDLQSDQIRVGQEIVHPIECMRQRSRADGVVTPAERAALVVSPALARISKV